MNAAAFPGSAGCPADFSAPLPSIPLSLQLQSDGIRLTGTCLDFGYTGTWSVSLSGEISVQGIYTSTSTINGQTSSASQAAILNVMLVNGSADSGGIVVSIKNDSGTLLLGPVTLQRTIR